MNDNTLVLHFEGGTTSSVRYDVKSVSKVNDNILIDIDYEFPSIVTADISYCCIIVELKNSYLNKDDKVGINFDSSEPARTYPLGLVIISLKG